MIPLLLVFVLDLGSPCGTSLDSSRTEEAGRPPSCRGREPVEAADPAPTSEIGHAAGPVEWRKDGAAALQEASDFRKPILAYFRAGSCKRSGELEKGALASEKVAEAARAFVPVWIDVDDDPGGWREKHGVRFTPTLLVLDRSGRRVEEIVDRDEAGLAARVDHFGAKLRGPWARSAAEALERGRAEVKPVVLVFWADAEEKPHVRLHAALGAFADAFVLAVVPLAPDAVEAKRFSVDEDKTWIVADPTLEKPERELIARILLKGERDAAKLAERMKRIADEWLRKHPRK